MNKSDMIREVASRNLHWSNQQIKREIRRRHGASVSSSQIVNTVGAHKKRIIQASYSNSPLKEAKIFLKLVGDYEQAKQLLAIAEVDK